MTGLHFRSVAVCWLCRTASYMYSLEIRFKNYSLHKEIVVSVGPRVIFYCTIVQKISQKSIHSPRLLNQPKKVLHNSSQNTVDS